MAQHAFPISDTDTETVLDDHDASSVDAMLVAHVLHGDTEAFATLFDRHASRIYALAYRIVSHKIEAEDITQDAFLHALNALPTLRRGDAFGPWLTRIATNLAWAALRHRARLPQAELSEAVTETYPDTTRWSSPEAIGVAAEDQRDVRLTLDRLAPSHRAALAMREIGGLSYADIASSLGTTTGSVEVLLFRARARFRDEYRKVAMGARAPLTMSCKQTPHVLAALADHEGDEQERVKAATHLRRCNACGAAFQAQKVSRKLLVGLPLTVPAAVRAALLSKAAPTLVSYTRGAAAGATVGAAGAVAASVVTGSSTGLGTAGTAVAAGAGGTTAGAAASLPILTTLGVGGLAGGLTAKIVAAAVIGAILAGAVALRHTPPRAPYYAAHTHTPHTPHTSYTSHTSRNRGVVARARPGGTLLGAALPHVSPLLRTYAPHMLAWQAVTPRLLFASVATTQQRVFVPRSRHTGHPNTSKVPARHVVTAAASRWPGTLHRVRGGIGGHLAMALPGPIKHLVIRAAPPRSTNTPASTARARPTTSIARRALFRRGAVFHAPRAVNVRRVHRTAPVAIVAPAHQASARSTPVPATAAPMAAAVLRTTRHTTPITPSPAVTVELTTGPIATPTAGTAIVPASSPANPAVSKQRPASRQVRNLSIGYARRAIASATAPALPPVATATATAPALPAAARPPAATATAPALPAIVTRAHPVVPTATRAPGATATSHAALTTGIRHAASTAVSGAASHRAITIVPSPTVLHSVLSILPTVTPLSVPRRPTVAATVAPLPTIIPNGANQHLSTVPTVLPAAVATTRAVVAVPTALATLVPNPTAATGQPAAVLTATPVSPGLVPPSRITAVPTLAPLAPPTIAPLPSTPPIPTVQAPPTTPPIPTVRALPTTPPIPTVQALPTALPAAVPTAVRTSVPAGVVTAVPSVLPVIAAATVPTPTAIATTILPAGASMTDHHAAATAGPTNTPVVVTAVLLPATAIATPTALPITALATPTALPIGVP